MKKGGGSRGPFLTLQCVPTSALLTVINNAKDSDTDWYKEKVPVKFTANEYEVDIAADGDPVEGVIHEVEPNGATVVVTSRGLSRRSAARSMP